MTQRVLRNDFILTDRTLMKVKLSGSFNFSALTTLQQYTFHANSGIPNNGTGGSSAVPAGWLTNSNGYTNYFVVGSKIRLIVYNLTATTNVEMSLIAKTNTGLLGYTPILVSEQRESQYRLLGPNGSNNRAVFSMYRASPKMFGTSHAAYMTNNYYTGLCNNGSGVPVEPTALWAWQVAANAAASSNVNCYFTITQYVVFTDPITGLA